MKPVKSKIAVQTGAYNSSDKFTSSNTDALNEARTLSKYDRQLALGANPNGHRMQASHGSKDSSVRSKRGHRKRGKRSMGRYPFLTTCNQLLRLTKGFYATSTQEERYRKLKRIYRILLELKESRRIQTTNPEKMTESEVVEFIGWCRTHFDASTTVKYLRFLDEVLQLTGNNSVNKVKLKYKYLIPSSSPKSIQTIPSDSLEHLLMGTYCLEDEWWDIVGKTAIAIYSHTGVRVSELRLARLNDLDTSRNELRVSQPKGKGKWANDKDIVPIMPGIENVLFGYLQIRTDKLRSISYDPLKVEPLFFFITRNKKVRYWSIGEWEKLKQNIELVSGIRFRWKDFRPTFAQKAKDNGAPIEAISKCLRHTSTETTEQFYARIRSETAFSLVRQAWEAPVASVQKPQN